MNEIKLREVRGEDIIHFYEHQLDPVARHMGAFHPPDVTDWDAFSARWERIRADETVTVRTIVVDGDVAGNLLSYEHLGRRMVGYWLGRDFWGRGIATAALKLFLQLLPARPLYAGVAKDNAASRRVLEKCGFVICGEKRAFAEARQAEIEEYEMRLDG